MNPNQCRVVLRPRGPLEVLDLAMRFSRESWQPLFRLAAYMVLPFAIPLAVAAWFLEGHWALLLAPLLLGPIIQAPFTLLGGRLLFAEAVPLWPTVKDTLRLAPVLLGGWLATSVALALSGITCFYGAPVAQMSLMYITETTLLEQAGVGRGVSRSLRLAGAALGTAGVAAMARWGLLIWFALVGEAVGQSAVGFMLQLGEPFGSLFGGQITPFLLTGMLLSRPAWAIYRLLLYVDVRTRTEGWDLQVGLRAAGLAQ